MEEYRLYGDFTIGCLQVSPVHVRIEKLRPVIAAHSHSNESYELHHAASGAGTVDVEGKQFEVLPDSIYITGPGVVHSQRSEPDNRITEYGLYLNCRRNDKEKDPYEKKQFALFAETIFWYGKDEGHIFPLLKQLIEENRKPMPDTGELSEILLRQIILQLTRMYRKSADTAAMQTAHADKADNTGAENLGSTPVGVSGKNNHSVRLEYHVPVVTREGLIPVLEDAFLYHYRDLSIKELADLLHLSVRQTQRLLKERFGRTFSQKLTEARMAAAAQLLRDTDLSVTAVSEKTGFSTIEHFSAAFRRFMGCSPRQYRKIHAFNTIVN